MFFLGIFYMRKYTTLKHNALKRTWNEKGLMQSFFWYSSIAQSGFHDFYLVDLGEETSVFQVSFIRYSSCNHFS